jgi:hypothetical protein
MTSDRERVPSRTGAASARGPEEPARKRAAPIRGSDAEDGGWGRDEGGRLGMRSADGGPAPGHGSGDAHVGAKRGTGRQRGGRPVGQRGIAAAVVGGDQGCRSAGAAPVLAGCGLASARSRRWQAGASRGHADEGDQQRGHHVGPSDDPHDLSQCRGRADASRHDPTLFASPATQEVRYWENRGATRSCTLNVIFGPERHPPRRDPRRRMPRTS